VRYLLPSGYRFAEPNRPRPSSSQNPSSAHVAAARTIAQALPGSLSDSKEKFFISQKKLLILFLAIMNQQQNRHDAHQVQSSNEDIGSLVELALGLQTAAVNWLENNSRNESMIILAEILKNINKILQTVKQILNKNQTIIQNNNSNNNNHTTY
jgi:hypothetical protein